MKSPDTLQQQVYSTVLSRSRNPRFTQSDDDIVTLTKTGFLSILKPIKVTKSPILQCLRASRVAIINMKLVKAQWMKVTEEDWEAFYIQTGSGTILDIQQIYSGYSAAYSPRILEMLQSHTLRNFR